MKNLLFIASLFSTSLFLISCGGDQPKEVKSQDTSQVEVETNGFSIDPSSMTIGWTAFKTSEKLPVKGEFKNITANLVKIPAPVDNKEMALNHVQFSLPISSLDSGNEARDVIIKALFFGIMTNSVILEGSLQVNENNTKEGKMTLIMNEETHSFPLSISYENNLASIKGIMDLNDWKTDAAQESLHKSCQLKHTGADGVAKTWSEVEIYGSVKIIGK